MKKVTIRRKPSAKAAPGSPDEWVADRLGSGEPMKRLTIDIPLSLHQKVKSQCALKGENMADAVRTLLEKHFGHQHQADARGSIPVADMQKHDSVTFSNHDRDQTETSQIALCALEESRDEKPHPNPAPVSEQLDDGNEESRDEFFTPTGQ